MMWVGGGGGFFLQAEDGIRDLVRSRGLGDVYKRQPLICIRTHEALCLAVTAAMSLSKRNPLMSFTIQALSLIHI